CKAVGRETVWDLLRTTWALTKSKWHEPSWGVMIAAAAAHFETDNGGRLRSREHLWTILWTESTYLIWKLRCERVIANEGKEFSQAEVVNRWYATLNSRLTLNRHATAAYLGKRALRPDTVRSTWLPILDNAVDLHPSWVEVSGVLVGIKRINVGEG
ncbi:uncharacterized protein TRAVEDRAFT_120779, partial [Trametes versicolor FP-101664 SS1]|uniref:uncharacterized protein n=1 Tax=Trametes versicolor (strain FP-101664) TaxID=717944 RepID=UPI0004622BE8